MATISVSLPSDGTTADASDYNTPITTIVNEINGNLDNANIKSGAAISGSKIADSSIDITSKASNFDGWVAVSDSWSYASATTITVPSDATTKYSVGDKLKIVQSGSTKYFYITVVTSTVLTVTGGSDYTVANSAITGIYYSKATTPQGFPQWFNYTPTLTGFSANPTNTVYKFKITGKSCIFFFRQSNSGTSNATTYTTTIPVTAATVTNATWVVTGQGVDNTTILTTPILATVSSAGTTATLYKTLDTGGSAWTGSGGKRATFTIEYEI